MIIICCVLIYILIGIIISTIHLLFPKNAFFVLVEDSIEGLFETYVFLWPIIVIIALFLVISKTVPAISRIPIFLSNFIKKLWNRKKTKLAL